MTTRMSYEYLQYVCNRSAKFNSNPETTVTGVDYTKKKCIVLSTTAEKMSSSAC